MTPFNRGGAAAQIPEVIGQLVERFGRNLATYKSPQYNETELRVEFVNPFWSAMGWDMDNKAGYAMAYRDVIHEDAVKVGTATKSPGRENPSGARDRRHRPADLSCEASAK